MSHHTEEKLNCCQSVYGIPVQNSSSSNVGLLSGQHISLQSHHQATVTSERFQYAEATSSAQKIQPFPFPEQNNYIHVLNNMEHQDIQLPASIDNATSKLGDIHVSPASSPPASTSPWSTGETENDDDNSDSDDDLANLHPKKYPVEIEHHDNKFCSYKRQSTSSGKKLKLVVLYDPLTLEHETSMREIKYYKKHLVRICRCGRYNVMDGSLPQGQTNNCKGYEIHYSQKCRWKAYDDFKTGKRVLIRLCKCYKPATD